MYIQVARIVIINITTKRRLLTQASFDYPHIIFLSMLRANPYRSSSASM